PGSATLSEPFLLTGALPRAAILISAPVVAGGTFRGVVCAVVDLQSVWDAVVVGHRTGHAVFAIDGKGRLFTATDLPDAPLGRPMGDSAIVRRFLENPGRATETIPFDWATRSGDYAERYLGSYEVSRQGWGIFV